MSMNNFELHEKAEQMTVSNTAYKLARRVIELEHLINMLQSNEKMLQAILETNLKLFEKELKEADHVLTNEELNKIKAEAVRDAAYKNRKAIVEGGDMWLCAVDDLVEYANKLESQAKNYKQY